MEGLQQLAKKALEQIPIEKWGKATAAKRGRNPAWPYVPIIDHTANTIKQRTEQIKGKAFKTRDEAIAYAQQVIDARKSQLEKNLAEPRFRALRKQYGIEA